MSFFNTVALLFSRQCLGESSQPRCKSIQVPNTALIPNWAKDCCLSPDLLSLQRLQNQIQALEEAARISGVKGLGSGQDSQGARSFGVSQVAQVGPMVEGLSMHH